MKVVNLTPHDITVMNEEQEIVAVFPKSGKVARLDASKELIRVADRVPFFSTKYGVPICLNENGEQVKFPNKEFNTIFIVSGLFRAGYNRSDLWQPGELVRNKDGMPTGCIGLSR